MKRTDIYFALAIVAIFLPFVVCVKGCKHQDCKNQR